MDGRRQSTRQKCLLRARVYFNDGRKSVSCVVRDISYEGARIIFSDPTDIPDEVQLYILGKKRLLYAQVRWRHANKIGLAFSRTIRLPSHRHPQKRLHGVPSPVGSGG